MCYRRSRIAIDLVGARFVAVVFDLLISVLLALTTLHLLISVLLAPTITHHHPWPLSPRYFLLLFVYAGRRISRPSSPRY